MKLTILWIFVLLLFGLILSNCLANIAEKFAVIVPQDASYNVDNSYNYNVYTINPQAQSQAQYDNYNHYDKTYNNITSGTIYYGPNGGKAVVLTDAQGKLYINVYLPNQPQPYVYNYVSATQWQGPNGTATLISTAEGGNALKITLNSGQTYIYTVNYSVDTTSEYDYSNDYKNQYYNQPPQSTTSTSTSTSSPPPPPQQPPPQQPPPPQQYPYIPGGIPRSMIPEGEEDLYILKSSVVPPVCPACPPPIQTDKGETCPPCPACARCPEPSFECKKIPKYSPANSILPFPVLNNFSQFGM